MKKLKKPKKLKAYIFAAVFVAVGIVLIVRTFAAADTMPPSAPSNLRTTGTTDRDISLAWDASTDDTGVKEYVVFRDGSPLATTVVQSTAPTFTDTGLHPNSTHTYYVVAKDSAGNQSPAPHPILTAFTKPDTTPPTQPTGLSGKFNIADKSVSLSWSPSTDNYKMSNYSVWRSAGGVLCKIGQPTLPQFTDPPISLYTGSSKCPSPLVPLNTTIEYFVIAQDSFGNQSVQSSSFRIKTDTEAPTVPANLKVTGVSNNSVAISWTASTDNLGIASYNIYRNGSKVGSKTYIQTYTFFDGNLASGTPYSYTVSAVDTSGLESAQSPAVVGITTGGTVTPPASPSSLQLSASGMNAQLSWVASATAGVTSYVVYRDGGAIGTVSTTSYTDSTAPKNKLVSYYVVAKSSIESAPSNIATIYFDTLGPNISFITPLDGETVSGNYTVSVNASDDQSLDRVEFYIDGSVVQSGSAKIYSWSTTSVPNGSHTIMAKAYDSSGNISTALLSATVKNGDMTPPSAPSNLVTNSLAYNKVSLAWNNSSDNVAVAGYYVVRNNVTIAQTVSNSFVDNSAVASNTYNYYVMAYDSAGNVSSASSPLQLTTPAAPVLDTTAPSTPSISTIAVVGTSQINLRWTASSDNIGVDHYDVFRQNAGDLIPTYTKIASVSGTSFGDTQLSAAAKYAYYVVAVDAAGNSSGQSAAKSARTSAESVKSKITGTVTDAATSLPISSATVSIYVSGGTKSYRTTTTGLYSISLGLNGDYRLRFIKQNYITTNQDVSISTGQTVVKDEALNSL